MIWNASRRVRIADRFVVPVIWNIARCLFLASPAILTTVGCNRHHAATPETSSEVRVAAAADLKGALQEVITEFQKRHSQITITPTYGASGNLFHQISNKAPFDLFLSADLDYPKKLAEQGLAESEGLFQYGRGHIVLWEAKDFAVDLDQLGMKALLDPKVKKIAIANPAHAPYGRAAVAAMKSAGVYDAAKDRIVEGENVAQTAQFVESGSVEIGIIAQSLTSLPAMKERGRYWIVPLDSYPPIEQGGIVLASAKDIEAAREFKKFLTGAEGKTILARYGLGD